ncbi:MAG: hypothetical protein HUU45_05525 [Leptospiraceae bacterium]|nr:hypothetical protein [Leptospiraceae bacterium]
MRFTKEFLKDYKSGFKRKPNLRLSENSKYYRIRSDILLTKLYEEKPFRNWFELPRLILKNLSSSGYFY